MKSKLHYFDMSYFDLQNVDVREVGFRQTTAVIHPQNVYQKSLNGCNLKKILFSAFFDDFHDVDLRGGKH